MESKIGILAGGGRLPALLIQHCQTHKQPFHVLTFKGQPIPDGIIPEAQHTLCPPGALGKMLKILKTEQVQQVVMAGRIIKPSLFDLRPDAQAIKFLASTANKLDDHLLKKLALFWESEGFEVIAPQDLLPELVTLPQCYTHKTPTDAELKDILLGMQVARELGKLDIGQGCVVKDGVILGVEATEGTDALIERCAELRGKSNKGGILIKCAKPEQTLKADMPAIGLQTIAKLAEYKYNGLAIEAERSLIIDAEAVAALADKKKIFMIGAVSE